jgi:hypothetical protein
MENPDLWKAAPGVGFEDSTKIFQKMADAHPLGPQSWGIHPTLGAKPHRHQHARSNEQARVDAKPLAAAAAVQILFDASARDRVAAASAWLLCFPPRG